MGTDSRGCKFCLSNSDIPKYECKVVQQNFSSRSKKLRQIAAINSGSKRSRHRELLIRNMISQSPIFEFLQLRKKEIVEKMERYC